MQYFMIIIMAKYISISHQNGSHKYSELKAQDNIIKEKLPS